MTKPTITHEQMLRKALTEVRRQRAIAAEYEENLRLARVRHENYNYCKHGTYIGDPYGADLLCGWCEDGDDPNPYDYALRYTRSGVHGDQADIDRLQEAIDSLFGAIGVFGGMQPYHMTEHESTTFVNMVKVLTAKQKEIAAKYE